MSPLCRLYKLDSDESSLVDDAPSSPSAPSCPVLLARCCMSLSQSSKCTTSSSAPCLTASSIGVSPREFAIAGSPGLSRCFINSTFMKAWPQQKLSTAMTRPAVASRPSR